MPYLIAVLVLFYLLIPLAQFYVTRKGVRTVPDRRTAKYWAIAVLGAVPYPIFVLGAIRALDDSTDGGAWWGAVVGAVVGGGLGIVALALGEQRQLRRDADARDQE